MVNTGRVALATPDTLPPPSKTDVTTGGRPHYVGPFDRISVDVLGLPELSRDVRVDAAGHVELPIAGSVDVTGQSPEELAQIIEARLRGSYVRNPQVTVSVLETVSQSVTVDGEVKMPGIYPVLGQMTLMRAVATAQGTSEYAKTSHVVVFRTVNGRQMAALYDLRAIRLGAYEDPKIYTNDVVVVGESDARRLFPQILQAAGLLVTPVIAYLNNH
uniref:polysaccharide biosynthesis/export family protein n=1 Tax=Altererythrobacter segetis TaxID=1104773 RepID=UPI00140B17E1